MTCHFDASLKPSCQPNHHLSLRLESVGEAAHVVRQAAVVGKELNVGTVDLDTATSLLLEVLLTSEGSEAPVLGDNDLLSARELVLRSSEGLKGNGLVYGGLVRACYCGKIGKLGEHTGISGADAHENLANVDTGNGTVGLAPGTTHTGLQSIGTGARQHLVDTDDVEGVGADSEVETLLTGVLDQVLVGADTGGLKSLGAQLLILVGDEVDAEREVIDVRTLSAQVEDSDLGVGDTTVESGLGIRLEKSRVSCMFVKSSCCLIMRPASFQTAPKNPQQHHFPSREKSPRDVRQNPHQTLTLFLQYR